MAVPVKRLTPEKALELGELVRALRTPTTQPEFVSDLDISSEWVSQVENGRLTSISLSKLAVLSAGLGLPKDALVRFIDGEPLPSQQTRLPPSSTPALSASTLYDELPPEDRQVVDRMIETLYERHRDR